MYCVSQINQGCIVNLLKDGFLNKIIAKTQSMILLVLCMIFSGSVNFSQLIVLVQHLLPKLSQALPEMQNCALVFK